MACRLLLLGFGKASADLALFLSHDQRTNINIALVVMRIFCCAGTLTDEPPWIFDPTEWTLLLTAQN